MKKGISKEKIIDKALEIIKDSQDFSGVNLRVVARELGCAHTNLYNYFSNFDQLLYEVYIKVLSIFSEKINGKISGTDDFTILLNKFFSEIVDFYLTNRGWFRLLWMEPIGGVYREKSYLGAARSVDHSVYLLEQAIMKSSCKTPATGQLKNLVHVVHCYIYGEVSLYIANHSFIQDDPNVLKSAKIIPFTNDTSLAAEASFRKYVVDEAMEVFLLFLSKKG